MSFRPLRQALRRALRLQTSSTHIGSRNDRRLRAAEFLENRALLAADMFPTLEEFQESDTNYVPGEVIIGFAPGSDMFDIPKEIYEFDLPQGPRSPRAELDLSGVANELAQGTFVAQIDLTEDPLEIASSLAKLGAVEFAEPNYLYSIDLIPDDPSFGSLFGLHNTGQTGGTEDADVDAVEAWDLQTGSLENIVGVVDTGIDYTHPDLYLNVWLNEDEVPATMLAQIVDTNNDGLLTFHDLNAPENWRPGNPASLVVDNNNTGFIDGGDLLADPRWSDGTDTDLNGFVDDLVGWDFVNNDNDPMDDNRHGTHVAGTIGAIGNNGVGVAGINWDVRLMGLKFIAASGVGSSDDAQTALAYAQQEGARMTNNSWGGGPFSQSFLNSVIANDEAGMLFVAAAGNSNGNNDLLSAYPSNYDVKNVIAVSATDHNDEYAGFSSYGATRVHLAAPGNAVLSTTLSRSYTALSGTSMATPHVAGAAALIWAEHPFAAHDEIKQILLETVDPIEDPVKTTITNGRLNIERALSRFETDEIAPAAITDLVASGATRYSANLTWTATGDDGLEGDARSYDIRYSTKPILNEQDWENAFQVNDEPLPQSPGQSEAMVLDGLKHSTTYHVVVRALDNVGNLSPLSSAAVIGTDIAVEFFYDDFNGDIEWEFDGLWHTSQRRATSPDRAFYYGIEGAWNYSAGENRGSLISPQIDLTGTDEAHLQFAEWSEVEVNPRYDRTRVDVSTDGDNWTTIFEPHRTDGGWIYHDLDLSAYAGQQIQLRFNFDTVDFQENQYEGWHIDDVLVYTPRLAPAVIVSPTTGLETDESGTQASFDVRLATAPSAPVTIFFAVDDPTEGSLSNGVAVFDSFSFDRPHTITITGIDDPEGQNFVDQDQTYNVVSSFTFSRDSNYAGLAVDPISVINRNTDEAPLLTLSDATAVPESDGAKAEFTLSLSYSPDQDVTVQYTTEDGTATAPNDYASASGTVTFEAGTTDLSRTIVADVADDVLDEDDEAFQLVLTAPSGALIANGTASAVITDDDAPPAASIGDATVEEGSGSSTTMSFLVNLSAPSGRDISIDYASSDGTATAGQDFTGGSGTLVIPAGQASGSVDVTIVGDLSDEFDETFTLTLSSATNASIADGQALGTIFDNDEAPTLAIQDASVTEGNSGTKELTFTVEVSEASGKPISVTFASADGSADSSDYTATSGTLEIPAGQATGSISVQVSGDVDEEDDETLTMTLSAPTNATLGNAGATGTIVNDDFPPTEAKLHAQLEVSTADWQTVTLPQQYDSMVVVGTPNYDSAVGAAVVRVRSAEGNSFQFRVQQTTDGASLAGIPVHFLIAEEGARSSVGGVAMEAVKVSSTVTDYRGNWSGESQAFQNTYSNPVVVGQVMTANDEDWSVFWSRGASVDSPASATSLFVGKHVGEDTDTTRSNETLGYFVFETGSATDGSLTFASDVGGDTIRGVGNAPPYNYSNILAGASIVVASQSGMDGGNGGWPILYGSNPITASSTWFAIDEDQIADAERSHTTEQVSYVMVALPGGRTTSLSETQDGSKTDRSPVPVDQAPADQVPVDQVPVDFGQSEVDGDESDSRPPPNQGALGTVSKRSAETIVTDVMSAELLEHDSFLRANPLSRFDSTDEVFELIGRGETPRPQLLD